MTNQMSISSFDNDPKELGIRTPIHGRIPWMLECTESRPDHSSLLRGFRPKQGAKLNGRPNAAGSRSPSGDGRQIGRQRLKASASITLRFDWCEKATSRSSESENASCPMNSRVAGNVIRIRLAHPAIAWSSIRRTFDDGPIETSDILETKRSSKSQVSQSPTE
jgi:hypothetical protein